MKSKIKNRKSKMFFIAAFFQILFAASLFSQKYENGTRLLKGAEVLSATPLQLDYVLEKLADTAKITVNLHEGKTHLVLDDGSGEWREWWYHQGKWKLKTTVESDPTIPGHVKSITTANVTNWNAAFGWGDHAAQGYMKNYTLPVATATILGGVKTGSRITIAADGTISANPQAWTDITDKPTFATVATSGNYNDLTNRPTIPAAYTLPPATASVLGGIKVGSGMSVTADGTLSATTTGGITTETDPTVPTHVKSITTANIANWNTAFTWGDHATQGYMKNYTLPIATATVLGGVKTGSRITIADDGTISANPQAWTDITGKPTFAAVATSGNYNSLSNLPTIPAPQVNADWNATSGVSQILNKPTIPTAYTLPAATASVLGGVKTGSRITIATDGTISANPQAWTDITGKPTFATVATTGNYNDLTNRPTITPGLTVQSGTWTPTIVGGGGTFSSSFWFSIGDIVHVSTILVMNTSATGTIIITNLPYPHKTNTSWNMSVNRTGTTAIPVAASIFNSSSGVDNCILQITNHSYNNQAAYYISGSYIKN